MQSAVPPVFTLTGKSPVALKFARIRKVNGVWKKLEIARVLLTVVTVLVIVKSEYVRVHEITTFEPCTVVVGLHHLRCQSRVLGSRAIDQSKVVIQARSMLDVLAIRARSDTDDQIRK